MFSVYLPFSNVKFPPPVPKNSPVLMLMATHWKRLPDKILYVRRSPGAWSLAILASAPRPVMYHTPARGLSLLSSRRHSAFVPERSVESVLPTLALKVVVVPSQVSSGILAAAFSVSHSQVMASCPLLWV